MGIAFPTASEVTQFGAIWEVGLSVFEQGFTLPDGFIKEVKGRFPSWVDLHQALDQQDLKFVALFLGQYQERLSKIGPTEIVAACNRGELEALLEQAQESVEFGHLLNSFEQRYFPELVKEREQRDQLQRESYN